jgi:predicted Zn finger-like uncharacterized protein
MIVTCDSCNANFKVDDSRIPDDGIKVRCSKCKHVFMVTREVPDDFLSEFEDFESFHKDQIETERVTGEETDEAPPEQFAKIPEEPAGGISFEQFMAKEDPLDEMQEAEPPAEGSIPEEFALPEEPPSEEVGLGTADSQLAETLESSEVEKVPSEEVTSEMGEPRLSVEDYFREEMEQESKSQSQEATLDSLKDKKFEDLVKGKGLEKKPTGRRSSFRTILLLILLLTLGVVAYLWWQNQGASASLPIEIGPTFKTAVGKISDLWDDVVGFRKGSLELTGLEGYEDEIGQHRVYIIKGDVNNKSRRARRSVKLRVIILDQAGNRIKEKEIFAGNVFTREELEKLSPRFFTGEEILQPKRPKDMVVEAHKTISFMVIFSGLPREGKSFKVEILEAPRG